MGKGGETLAEQQEQRVYVGCVCGCLPVCVCLSLFPPASRRVR